MSRAAALRNWWHDLKGHQRISLAFDFVIVLATTTYAIIASCQLRSMNASLAQTKTLAEQSVRQANAAIVAANAASAQVATSLEALELSERPWVETTKIGLYDPLAFDSRGYGAMNLSIKVRNVGHSVAQNVIAKSKIVSFNGQDLGIERDRFCGQLRNGSQVRGHHGILLFPGDPETEILDLATISPDEVRQMLTTPTYCPKGQMEIAVVGCVAISSPLCPLIIKLDMCLSTVALNRPLTATANSGQLAPCPASSRRARQTGSHL